MTKDEKFDIIVERLGDPAKNFNPIHLSVLILLEYMEILFKNGIILEGPVEVAPIGKQATAICQEFDWAPSDSDIVTFCKDMVNEGQVESFIMMLKSMRDDRETFLKNAKKHIGY